MQFKPNDMQKYLLLALLSIISFHSTKAQHLHCGTSEKMQQQLELDKDLQRRRAEIEAFTQQWIAEHGTDASGRAVVTIPVVVHVVYRTEIQNLNDFQIMSQIAVLNEDYRSANTDITGVPSVWDNLIADVEIEFALATCDPNGYATNGITRTQTSVVSWNGSDDVKVTADGGHDPWPTSDYLNIWVCNIGAGLLGYAYQPGINPWIDGVVIGYQYFGRPSSSNTYDLGRTATHEIGHYFNLDHLWGPSGSNTNCVQDDYVLDTPRQQEPNFGCSTTFPNESCGTGADSDMFNNFMDYGNDECLFFFTEGQKARMLAALNGPRESLLSSNGLNQCPVGVEEHILESSLLVYPNPATDIINIRSDRMDNLVTDLRIIDLSGRVVLHRGSVKLGHASTPLDVSELSTGTYVLEVRSENELVTKKIHITQ